MKDTVDQAGITPSNGDSESPIPTPNLRRLEESDIRVALHFLMRAPANGAREAEALVRVIGRLQGLLPTRDGGQP